MKTPSRIAYMLIKICGLFGLENMMTKAITNPPIPAPIISGVISAGFSATIENENIAPIATSANKVSVLFTVPSRVILSVVTPPWKYCGASAGLLLR